MNLPDKQSELEELILKEMDGVCSESEFAKLSDRLCNDPEAMDYYLEFVSFCAGMLRPGEISVTDDRFHDAEDVRVTELWLALAEDERTAETIDIEDPARAIPVSVCREQTVVSRQKVSLFPLYTALSLIAALLVMIAYVVTHPRKAPPNAVATLTGSSGAVWLQANHLSGDKRLYTDSTMTLVEGFAEITFDNQAKIILQSPAEIGIEDFNQIFLRSGKLSAVIPKTAWGFVVRSTGASVVDYGTEFGVTADLYGKTEVHVFVGKVELRSGSDPVRFGARKSLTQGQAGCVDETGELTAGPMKAYPSSFVRRLPQKMTFGRPGKRLDLADIVGGGNGFGTGQECVGIDPATGKLATKLITDDRMQELYRYCLVPEMPCIDGVFVPLGGESPQVITSQGHVFEGFPETDGRYWIEITNLPVTSMMPTTGDNHQGFQFARLGRIQYGTPLHPAVILHANAGITFDLDAIRSMNPRTQIQRFTSLCGLSDTLADTPIWNGAMATLWVLVDGQEREMIQISSSAKQQAYINIDITENDRFLTLVATDGQNKNGGDWTLFGDPALELESVN